MSLKNEYEVRYVGYSIHHHTGTIVQEGKSTDKSNEASDSYHTPHSKKDIKYLKLHTFGA